MFTVEYDFRNYEYNSNFVFGIDFSKEYLRLTIHFAEDFYIPKLNDIIKIDDHEFYVIDIGNGRFTELRAREKLTKKIHFYKIGLPWDAVTNGRPYSNEEMEKIEQHVGELLE